MDSQGTVPAEERGVKVYDLQGNLQQFIPVPQESGNALLLLFTPDYVFFCDDRNGSYCRPCIWKRLLFHLARPKYCP